MSFRVRGLPLRFDTNGNVDTGYDLKLWVWRDPEPELRTVGGFDGRLQLQLPQMRWHTPGNAVSARPCPHCTATLQQGLPRLGGAGGEGGPSPGSGGAPSPAKPESEDPAPEARVPVLEAVPGGPGPPREGVPLLLLRLRGLQGRQLPAQPRSAPPQPAPSSQSMWLRQVWGGSRRVRNVWPRGSWLRGRHPGRSPRQRPAQGSRAPAVPSLLPAHRRPLLHPVRPGPVVP